jgi:hypothetical protein
MKEIPEIETLFDLLSENPIWDLCKEDNIHFYIRNTNLKERKPHLRVRKDNGMVDCLNGITFRYGPDVTIGRQMTAKQLCELVRKE